jgi:hypothetical protein
VSFVFVNPDVVAAAATHLANIGATISDAKAAAAAFTTELVPAAEDEISAGIAGLFGTYAQNYHALAAQAAAFHDRFLMAVNASAGSYVTAEGANAAGLFQTAQQGLLGAINAPTEALPGHPLIGTGTGTPAAAIIEPVVIGAAGIVPENAYPFGGLKQLTFTQSTLNGLQILDNTLQPYIAAGTPVTVFGYSQSAVVASLEMAKLQAEGVPSSAVNFLIIGDPMNPNGGFFERFAGLVLPSLGFNFFGATPSNAYPTSIYTLQYDSFADFPQYPLDILSDANAVMSLTHFDYHLATMGVIDSAIQLPTSGPTTTSYYMIPLDNLPLLDPLRSTPIIGNPIADLLQPDLTYLVNLGYGDPRYGWSTGPANVPTPIGLLPPLSAFQELPGLLASGTQQGIQNFLGDFNGTGPHPVTLPSVSSVTSLLEHPSSLLTALLNPSAGTASGTSAASGPVAELSALAANPAALGPALTNVANRVSDLASRVSGIVVGTADIANAALISVPSYGVDLFFNGILQALNGQPAMGLANAIGLPIASDIAMWLWLYNLEYTVIYAPSESAGPATGIPALGIS